MYKKDMLRKLLPSWKLFIVILLLTNWQALFTPVSSQRNYPTFELIKKQSETCGQLDIIPDDIRTFAPWAVAIYRRTRGNKWIFHTSGTILGPGLVYSVQTGEPGRFSSDKNPRNFFIAAGINSTDFNSHDQFAQFSRISLILPYITEVDTLSHQVLYYLDAPLDVRSTPFVRDICLPFFASNTRFINNLVQAVQSNVRLEAIQYGFARSSKLKDGRNRENSNSNSNSNLASFSKERKLKLWYIISQPEEKCQRIFRFYYGKTPSTRLWCTARNTENIRGIVPFKRILEKYKVPDSGDISGYPEDKDDEFFCHGAGSSPMLSFGDNWFMGITVGFVPSMKKLRCNSKTVYFTALPPIKKLLDGVRGIFNAFNCPHGTATCLNFETCVNITQTCDQKIDCVDSSDEDPILCDWKLKLKKRSNPLLENRRFQLESGIEARAVNKRCPSLDFNTEGVRCRDPETLEEIDCEGQFFTGREILVDCDDYHYAPKFTTKSMTLFCNFEAEWSALESIVCRKKCGIHNPGTKKYEKYMRFPWDAAIFQNGGHVCGGSLIQDNFILSHANCVKHWIEFPGKRTDLQVFIRPVSSNYEENRRSNFTHWTKIKDVWISVNNLEDKYESGIALIKLETPVLTNRKNAPMAVCSVVPPFSKVNPGKIGKILSSYQRGGNANNFTIDEAEECDEILNGRSVISKNEFCVSLNLYKGQKLLQGSGLVFVKDAEKKTLEKTSHTLLGIASKIEEGRAVFLQVNSFSEWIIDILETNS